MPWADVRLNTEANFETVDENQNYKENDKTEDLSRVPVPPFGWYRWADEKAPPIREGDNLRLPPIRDGRKISYISFVITEEEVEEGKDTLSKDTDEKTIAGQIESEEPNTEEKNNKEEEKKEGNWKEEDIFSRSLAPETFRLALASLPQGIEQTGRETR